MYADGTAHTMIAIVNTRKNAANFHTVTLPIKCSSLFLPSLAVHSPSPDLLVGSLDVVVTVSSVRGLGKVGALAAGSSGGAADGEFLGYAEWHQSLRIVQREGQLL